MTSQTPQGFMEAIKGFHAAIPDLKSEIIDMVEEGDRLVLRFNFTGTHKGEFLGFPGSGAKLNFQGMIMRRFVGQKVAEDWDYFDFPTVVAQIQQRSDEILIIESAIPRSTQDLLNAMYLRAKYDGVKVAKALAKSIITKVKPSDVGTAYLPISKEQGEYLFHLICERNIKNIVEFGTSFGISTLYLAEAVKHTGGHVITTEIVPEKYKEAKSTFKKAGLDNYISLLEGDALKTLKQVDHSIDLLLLDGWKELYLPVFRLLEPFFHKKTLVFVDNTNMKGVKDFLKAVSKETEKYQIEPLMFDKGNTVLISLK